MAGITIGRFPCEVHQPKPLRLTRLSSIKAVTKQYRQLFLTWHGLPGTAGASFGISAAARELNGTVQEAGESTSSVVAQLKQALSGSDADRAVRLYAIPDRDAAIETLRGYIVLTLSVRKNRRAAGPSGHGKQEREVGELANSSKQYSGAGAADAIGWRRANCVSESQFQIAV
ncbi:hypothetical protein ACG873_03090 [Mesorhizobium sp. AaZ16]|uniref:hypothetical protein n=1 Tax=Mesorhizobium sp. AaZ16 TaxID=3402289 RepID=UPI00374FAB11